MICCHLILVRRYVPNDNMEAGDGGRVNRDVGLLTASDQVSSPLQRVAVGSNHEYSCLAAGLFQRLCCHNDENLQKKDFQKKGILSRGTLHKQSSVASKLVWSTSLVNRAGSAVRWVGRGPGRPPLNLPPAALSLSLPAASCYRGPALTPAHLIASRASRSPFFHWSSWRTAMAGTTSLQ